MLCAHCNTVHHQRQECSEIRALRSFCGDDEYQRKLELKANNKKRFHAKKS